MADVESTRRDDVAVLIVRGNLDAMNMTSLKLAVNAIEDSRMKKVVVDLKALRQIDSSGVGVLVSMFKRVRSAGGQVRFAGVTGQPHAVFKLLGLDKAFDVCGTVEVAVARLNASE